jgi:SAM-dependent methyltransferase
MELGEGRARDESGMKYEDYVALKRRIVPQLRFNQEIYEGAVTEYVTEQTTWLDAGCGHHILPVWRREAEQRLIKKARLVVGCDADQVSLRKHCTLDRLVVADLTGLPFKAESVNLITCNMVVEHIDRPLEVFAEFARILKSGGRVIVHTPNAYSHFVVGSRFVPRRLKLRLIRALDGREESDVFPTRYRANTPTKLRALMAQVGLRQERCRMLASDAASAVTHPLLAVPELLYIGLTLHPAFKFLRFSILASFVKPVGGRP